MRHLALVLGAGLAASGCIIEAGAYGGRASDVWTRSYPIAAGGSVTILNVNGRIEVDPAEGATIEVRAERDVRAFDDKAAKDALARIEMREDVSPSSIRIETRSPDRWNFGRSQNVTYRVRIPAGLRAYFSTTNGKVSLRDVRGQLTARTTNGGVDAYGVGGSLEARTTNGGLHIDMAEVTGELMLRTTNGGIRLHLPASTKAAVELSCTNGGINIDRLPFDGDISRRHVSGNINGGGARITARTTNGGVRVTGRT